MASYARDALDRVERARTNPRLNDIRRDLEAALGIDFQDDTDGRHFFHSTLVQTLFYGVFSAWVLQAQSGSTQRFDWRVAAYHLHVPVISALFERLATASNVRSLGLEEVLDWTGDALARVDSVSFFRRFEADDAVQYFYEPFLEAFDPALRRSLGVWYTPKEIVRYQVGRVDRELRECLGVSSGLADDNVHILDPCCGTGAYLREALRIIGESYQRQGLGALVGQKLREAATTRIHGFEIMPAPFVVAHLQIGLYLQGFQAPLDADQRAGVYLTNALTGWIPDEDRQHVFSAMPELQEERDTAVEVKRLTPILVILGNPPYSGYAGVAKIAEERDLVRPYRQVQRVRPPEGQGLNDLYVRFFRMAERRIAKMTGRGVISFISNYSWLDGLSFTGMREHFLATFDCIRVDNLHGDRRISEYAPDGRTSETVFAVGGQSVGIRVGTAISTLVSRTGKRQLETSHVLYRDFEAARAQERRADLLASLDEPDSAWTPLSPSLPMGLPFKPGGASVDYFAWPKLTELMPTFFPGVKTSRDEFLVSIDRAPLEERVRHYFDLSLSDREIEERYPSVMIASARYDPIETRRRLLARGPRLENIVRYAYRPFDVRWLYWESETKLLDEKRPEYWLHADVNNSAIAIPQRHRRMWGLPQVVHRLSDLNILDGSSAVFPDRLIEFHSDDSDHISSWRNNNSQQILQYFDNISTAVRNVFQHIVAVLHSPSYRTIHNDALRTDWPRIPLPESATVLATSAGFGARLIDLLDVERQAAGVTTGTIPPDLARMGVVTRRGGGQLSNADLMLKAGWGHGGNGRPVMPARGSIRERAYTDTERAALAAGAEERGMELETALALLGETCFDVDLNGNAFWSCVPAKVWTYQLGGYQVIKKWLSYREEGVLGRGLRHDEVQHVTHMVRRIAEILLMGPALDANYQRVIENAVDWSAEQSRQTDMFA